VNAWAADHAHNLAGATPLVALDMYEHSYHMDFGAKAAAYVDAFMQNLSWTAPRRLSPGLAPEHDRTSNPPKSNSQQTVREMRPKRCVDRLSPRRQHVP
jgi:hypothetical protein